MAGNSNDADSVAASRPNDKCHEFGLELVLKTPLPQVTAGKPIELQVMRTGKPLPDARVTFVPRGTTLASGFDEEYERQSDSDGLVQFTPKQGNVLFAVVHLMVEDESGDGYDKTAYSAAMVVKVPN
ncbi:MAG: DUF4198 domain-containing protein [Pirellulaceae bacterium]